MEEFHLISSFSRVMVMNFLGFNLNLLMIGEGIVTTKELPTFLIWASNSRRRGCTPFNPASVFFVFAGTFFKPFYMYIQKVYNVYL